MMPFLTLPTVFLSLPDINKMIETQLVILRY